MTESEKFRQLYRDYQTHIRMPYDPAFREKVQAECDAEIEVACKRLWSVLYPKKAFDPEFAREKMPAAQKIWEAHLAKLTEWGKEHREQKYKLFDELVAQAAITPLCDFKSDKITHAHTTYLDGTVGTHEREAYALCLAEWYVQRLKEYWSDVQTKIEYHPESYSGIFVWANVEWMGVELVQLKPQVPGFENHCRLYKLDTAVAGNMVVSYPGKLLHLER